MYAHGCPIAERINIHRKFFNDIGFAIIILIAQCNIASVGVGFSQLYIDVSIIINSQMPGTANTVNNNNSFKIARQRKTTVIWIPMGCSLTLRKDSNKE